LLSDLLKHTPSDHDDYENLTKAVEEAKKTADGINESKRSADTVVSINENMIGEFESLVITGRLFVKEGPLIEKIKGDTKPRYFFLFTDCLVHAKPKDKKDATKYEFKRTTLLKKVTIGEILDSGSDKHPIKLILPDGSDITLFAESEEEKISWLQEFSKVLEALNSATTFLAGTGIENLKRTSMTGAQLKEIRTSTTPTRSSSTDRIVRKSPSGSGTPPMTPPQRVTSTLSAEDLGGWKEATTPEGKKYYYNRKTGQTTWDKPSSFT